MRGKEGRGKEGREGLHHQMQLTTGWFEWEHYWKVASWPKKKAVRHLQLVNLGAVRCLFLFCSLPPSAENWSDKQPCQRLHMHGQPCHLACTVGLNVW